MLADFFAGWAFAYLGMLALCQGLERHYKQLWHKVPPVSLRHSLRAAGWLSLGLGHGPRWLVRHAFVEWVRAIDAAALSTTAGGMAATGFRPRVGHDHNPDLTPCRSELARELFV